MSGKKGKKGGKFKAFLRNVFVKNIDLKLFSIIFAVAVTLLVVGFGGCNQPAKTARCAFAGNKNRSKRFYKSAPAKNSY